MKHTQGKWKVIPVKVDGEILYYEIGKHGDIQHFATVIDNEYLNISMNGAEANARFIASAPELLEALKEIMKEYVMVDEDKRPFAFDQVCNAIKKAEGK